jgi:hypothetical protein
MKFILCPWISLLIGSKSATPGVGVLKPYCAVARIKKVVKLISPHMSPIGDILLEMLTLCTSSVDECQGVGNKTVLRSPM